MSIRARAVVCVALMLASSSSWQDDHRLRAEPPAFSQISDDVLKTLEIEPATIAKNEKARTLLAEGVRLFRERDGMGAHKVLDLAKEADASLPDAAALLGRLILATKPEEKEALKFDPVTVARLIEIYQRRSNADYERSRAENDADKRRDALSSAMFDSRVLMKLKPEDPNYRFNIAYISQELGDHKSAQAIMDDLAPRNRAGFAKAHLWQADQLLSPDAQLTPETMDAAEAHLLHALTTYTEPDEIHRRLGELYYYRYRRPTARQGDLAAAARDVYLNKAEEHLSKVVHADVKLRLTFAEIHHLQGRTQQAEQGIAAVIDSLVKQLADKPDDVDLRLQLARAYRMVRKFADAIEVLRQGRALLADERLDQELSNVYYYLSIDTRQRSPEAWEKQFAPLQQAYRSNPANNYVAHRFVQALTSKNEAEAEAARTTLRELVKTKAPGQLATFLVGFDHDELKQSQLAEQHFAALRALKPDRTPEVIASLAAAVSRGQVKTIDPAAVDRLFESALSVWPADADLLLSQAQKFVTLRNYSSALEAVKKALQSRPDSVKGHEMAALIYQMLGQADDARLHRDEAAALRAKQAAPLTNRQK